jgi:hypothetical protein
MPALDLLNSDLTLKHAHKFHAGQPASALITLARAVTARRDASSSAKLRDEGHAKAEAWPACTK